MVGLPALTLGVSGYLAAEQITLRLVKERGEGVLGYCYAASYTAVILATIAGGVIGWWCAKA